LDRQSWYPPAALALLAACAALSQASQLTHHTFRVDRALLGTPAAENIKAPFDIEVVDPDTTARLRAEAEAKVPRVYDFDVHLGQKSADLIAQAFADARGRIADRRPNEARRDLLLTIRPGLEKSLGFAFGADQFARLAERDFSASAATASGRLILAHAAEPIVASRQVLGPDIGRGISVQRVPDDKQAEKVVSDVSSITELEEARRDLPTRARSVLGGVEPADVELATYVAGRLLQPNLTLNRAATELARELARLAVKPVGIGVSKGEMIVRDGERYNERHLLILQALNQARRRSASAMGSLGSAAIVLALLWAAMILARGLGLSLARPARDLTFLWVICALTFLATRVSLAVAAALYERFGGLPGDAYRYVVPIAAAVMITRLVLSTEVALLVGAVISTVAMLMLPGHPLFGVYALVGSVFGASTLRTIQVRSDLIRAGVGVGLGQAAAAVAIQLFGGEKSLSAYALCALAAVVSGLLAALIALALTPAVEALFGYTTDLNLLELGNLNHPALKDLLVQAPGSYHHSIMVGTLVEAAAEAIGANPLLARVMAYYHDLGKGRNPSYFIENQRTGQNPHDKLKPSMSAMIIRRHVADGMELATQYGLGEPIVAAIGQHHGTTLIHFFYHKAKDAEVEGQTVSESDYRYPGPKPQSREVALVMLADAIEAGARTLADPDPARLQGVVNRIINVKFADGQLEECDLTLKDLHTIAKSFSRVLASIYHERVEYPEMFEGLTGKKNNDDHDPKPPRDASPDDAMGAADGHENLRRLGLS